MPDSVITAAICLFLAAVVWCIAFVLEEKTARIVALAGLAAVLALFWTVRSQYIALESDAPFHLSMLREAGRSWKLFLPGDPFFAGAPTPLHYGAAHTFGALLAMASGSVETAWSLLGLLNLVLSFAVVFSFCRAVWTDSRVAWAFGLLFSVKALACGMVPNMSGFSELAVFGAYAAIARGDGGRGLAMREIAGIAIACGIAVATRMFSGLVGYVSILLCLALCRSGAGSREGLRGVFPGVVLVAVPLAVAGPWLANFAAQYELFSRGSAATAQGWTDSYCPDFVKALVSITPGAPLTLVDGVVAEGFLAGVIVLAAGTRAGFRTAGLLRFLVGFHMLLFLVPWKYLLAAIGIDAERAGRMMEIVVRTRGLAPLEFVVFAAVVAIAARGRTLPSAWRRLCVGAVAFAVLLACLFDSSAHLRMRLLVYGPHARPRFEYVCAGMPDPVRSSLAGATVLSDCWTSYMTQYELGFRAVATPEGHSSPAVDVASRTLEIGRFFAGRDPDPAGFLRRYRCEYVLVNGPLARGESIPYFEFRAPEYKGWRSDYLDSVPCLQKEYSSSNAVLYRVVTP